MPDATIKFTASRPGALQPYRFALETADFLLCRHCGVYLGAVIKTPSGTFGIVNTRALEPQSAELQTAVPSCYDGEDAQSRIARRERRWSRAAMVP